MSTPDPSIKIELEEAMKGASIFAQSLAAALIEQYQIASAVKAPYELRFDATRKSLELFRDETILAFIMAILGEKADIEGDKVKERLLHFYHLRHEKLAERTNQLSNIMEHLLSYLKE